MYWHFAGDIDPPVWALCLFVLPFSFAIAVLKDVPDIEGDRRYSIRTFTVRLGARAGVPASAWRRSLIAYAGMIVVAPLAAARTTRNPVVLAVGHVAAAALLLVLGEDARIRATTPNSRASTCGCGHSSSWSTCWCPIACLAT